MSNHFALISPVPRQLMEEAGDDGSIYKLMRNRLMVGECRYGQNPFPIDPDQEATIGKHWQRGYDFLANWPPEEIERRLNGKVNKYHRTGNRELIIDVLNYFTFLFLLDYRYSRAYIRLMLEYWIDEFWTPEHPEAHWRCEDQEVDGVPM